MNARERAYEAAAEMGTPELGLWFVDAFAGQFEEAAPVEHDPRQLRFDVWWHGQKLAGLRPDSAEPAS